MARWIDERRDPCVRSMPCPGCAVPSGDLHRPGCVHAAGVLRDRIRRALRAREGLRSVARVLADLATDRPNWWWHLELEGVTREQFEEALADVLEEAAAACPRVAP